MNTIKSHIIAMNVRAGALTSWGKPRLHIQSRLRKSSLVVVSLVQVELNSDSKQRLIPFAEFRRLKTAATVIHHPLWLWLLG